MKPFACWWLQELSWNLKGRREEWSPVGCAFPQKVTALFCTQTLNREVVTVIFLLSFIVRLEKAKAIPKVQFSGLDLNNRLVILTFFLFLEGKELEPLGCICVLMPVDCGAKSCCVGGFVLCSEL